MNQPKKTILSDKVRLAAIVQAVRFYSGMKQNKEKQEAQPSVPAKKQ